MPKYTDFAAAIFDVDDTLLNNHPKNMPGGLHEHSRLQAAHEVGKRHGSQGLRQFTLAQCAEAHRNAKAHTLEATVWQMLVMGGEVMGDAIESGHPLLLEIMERKEELHEDLLRTHGREVPGATRFVKALAHNGLAGKLAIASTANRRDIQIFLEMTGLDTIFPAHTIISREQLTHPKPHPEAFNLAFAALGLPEGARPHVAAFEDDPRGIMSAKAAGLYTYAITTKFSKNQLAQLAVPPDLTAGSFAEFSSLFGLPASGSED
jgi:beta-phosphoglucomutase-like phosphatase (HAD superfamily)